EQETRRPLAIGTHTNLCQMRYEAAQGPTCARLVFAPEVASPYLRASASRSITSRAQGQGCHQKTDAGPARPPISQANVLRVHPVIVCLGSASRRRGLTQAQPIRLRSRARTHASTLQIDRR